MSISQYTIVNSRRSGRFGQAGVFPRFALPCLPPGAESTRSIQPPGQPPKAPDVYPDCSDRRGFGMGNNRRSSSGNVSPCTTTENTTTT